MEIFSKVSTIIFVMISALFVFFPYTPCIAQKKSHSFDSDFDTPRRRCCSTNKFFALMSCFAAGMLLSLSLCHILPEATEGFDTLQNQEFKKENQQSDIQSLSTFQGESQFLQDRPELQPGNKLTLSSTVGGETTISNDTSSVNDSTGTVEEKRPHDFPYSFVLFLAGFLIMLFLDQVLFKETETQLEENLKLIKIAVVNDLASSNNKNCKICNSQGTQTTEIMTSSAARKEDETRSFTQHGKHRVSTQALAIFGIALIFHSFIEGLTIGVFDGKEVGVIVAGVSIHKIPVACTLGTTFKAQKKGINDLVTQAIFTAFIFATPLGIMVGESIGGQENSITLLTIQSMSGGTFVYLACCDLIVHNFHIAENEEVDDDYQAYEGEDEMKSKSTLFHILKFLFLCFGASIVIFLVIMFPA